MTATAITMSEVVSGLIGGATGFAMTLVWYWLKQRRLDRQTWDDIEAMTKRYEVKP